MAYEASGDEPDPDDEARADALHAVTKRLAIWALPLFLLGAFLTALGIPLWISVIAVLVVAAAVVLEIDV